MLGDGPEESPVTKAIMKRSDKWWVSSSIERKNAAGLEEHCLLLSRSLDGTMPGKTITYST